MASVRLDSLCINGKVDVPMPHIADFCLCHPHKISELQFFTNRLHSSRKIVTKAQINRKEGKSLRVESNVGSVN
jgi:hypothetical protein